MCVQAASHANAKGELYTVDNCCSLKPMYSAPNKPMFGKPCDPDHYCNYIDAKEYRKTTVGGIVVMIIMSVVAVATVLLRDIMKVWTCFGLTDAPSPTPDRQLTTMSAAYAPATMPSAAAPSSSFQNVPVPMGSPQQAQPMQQMQFGGPVMGGYGQPPMMGGYGGGYGQPRY